MKKRTVLSIVIILLGLAAFDTRPSAIIAQNPFSGRQTWALEELSAPPAPAKGSESTAVASATAADYYICKESGGGIGTAVLAVFESGPLP